MCATPRRWVTTLGRQPAAAGPCRLPRRPPDRPGSRRVWCEGDAAAGPEIHAPPTTQLPLPKPRSRAGRPRLQRGAAARCRRSPPATVWCGVRSVHGRLVMGRPASPPLPYRRRCAAAADPPTPEGAAGALPHPPPPTVPVGGGGRGCLHQGPLSRERGGGWIARHPFFRQQNFSGAAAALVASSPVPPPPQPCRQARRAPGTTNSSPLAWPKGVYVRWGGASPHRRCCRSPPHPLPSPPPRIAPDDENTNRRAGGAAAVAAVAAVAAGGTEAAFVVGGGVAAAPPAARPPVSLLPTSVGSAAGRRGPPPPMRRPPGGPA